MPTDPKVLAVLLAQGHAFDPKTGTHSLLGIVNRLRVDGFPAVVPQLFCYVALTGLNGEYALRLSIHRARDDEEVAYADGVIPRLATPLEFVEVLLGLEEVPLEVGGRYIFKFAMNGAVLHEFVIEAEVDEA